VWKRRKKVENAQRVGGYALDRPYREQYCIIEGKGASLRGEERNASRSMLAEIKVVKILSQGKRWRNLAVALRQRGFSSSGGPGIWLWTARAQVCLVTRNRNTRLRTGDEVVNRKRTGVSGLISYSLSKREELRKVL